MKPGGIFALYMLFGIWTATNRIENVLLIVAGVLVISITFSVIARIVKSNSMVSFWNQVTKKVIVVAIIGITAKFTWGPAIRLVANLFSRK